jgi:hypothetical protein
MRERYATEPTRTLAAQLGRTDRAVYMRADFLGLKKSVDLVRAVNAANVREAGVAHRFKPGHSTWNKGVSWTAGGRSAETRFVKGARHGAAAMNLQPIGTERVNKDGITIRKVADTGCKRVDWRPVHVLLWEQHNGPVPAGHIVVFKDRNAENVTIENLDCITRAENMRRNSHHNRYPKEVSRLIQLRGALNRKINTLERAP